MVVLKLLSEHQVKVKPGVEKHCPAETAERRSQVDQSDVACTFVPTLPVQFSFSVQSIFQRNQRHALVR